MQNWVKIGRSAAELLRIFDFQNGRHPPFWIWYDVVADHHLLVFDGPNILLKLRLNRFYPRDVVSGVFATATWLAGWLAGWVAVCRSLYCIKTTKSILKLFRPSDSPIIEAFGTPCADTKFQGEPLQRGR